jgi:hypothetical protein
MRYLQRRQRTQAYAAAEELEMQTRTVAVAGGLALALVLTESALAQRGEDSYYRPPAFSDLDINRDGVLDRAEVQARTPMYGVWDRVDVNNDDLIDQSEFAAFEVEQPAPRDSSGPIPMTEPGSRDDMR